MAYNGEERRRDITQMSQKDRDLLIRMDQNVMNLIETMQKHSEDDQAMFKKHNSDLDWLKRVAYTGIGGMVVLNVFLHWIK